MNDILVLYYSRHGATRELALAIAHGIDSVPGMQARIRTVPPVSPVFEATQPALPADAPRQHGGPAQIIPRRHGAAMALRRPRRQARLCLHVDGQPARRAGIDLAVDDAAALASR